MDVRSGEVKQQHAWESRLLGTTGACQHLEETPEPNSVSRWPGPHERTVAPHLVGCCFLSFCWRPPGFRIPRSWSQWPGGVPHLCASRLLEKHVITRFGPADWPSFRDQQDRRLFLADPRPSNPLAPNRDFGHQPHFLRCLTGRRGLASVCRTYSTHIPSEESEAKAAVKICLVSKMPKKETQTKPRASHGPQPRWGIVHAAQSLANGKFSEMSVVCCLPPQWEVISWLRRSGRKSVCYPHPAAREWRRRTGTIATRVDGSTLPTAATPLRSVIFVVHFVTLKATRSDLRFSNEGEFVPGRQLQRFDARRRGFRSSASDRLAFRQLSSHHFLVRYTKDNSRQKLLVSSRSTGYTVLESSHLVSRCITPPKTLQISMVEPWNGCQHTHCFPPTHQNPRRLVFTRSVHDRNLLDSHDPTMHLRLQ